MFTIRKATIDDAEGKGYVHYTSWIETYTGLFDQPYLDRLSLERSIQNAKDHPENTYVALVENKVVGFACYLEARDEDISNAGEIMALYVLKAYQKQGIGQALMEACYQELTPYNTLVLWVLKANKTSVSFYQKQGFTPDGNEKTIYEQPVIRMIKQQNNM